MHHPLSEYPTALRWLEELDRQGKSPHTVSAYRRALVHFICWNETTYGQPFVPSEIIARDVAGWQMHQQTVEGAKPSTVNQRLVGLKRFFGWSLSQGHVKDNPAAEIRSLRPERRRPKALSSVEQRRLLRAVHAGGRLRDIAMVETLLGTGLRVGELLALERRDVVLGERSGQVTVRRGKQGVHRVVPLTAPIRRALVAYVASLPHMSQPISPFWLGERGPLRDRSAVSRVLAKYAYDARLTGSIGAHTLRHTFATRYLEANPHDLRGLAALMGHASLDTVMIYTEPSLTSLVRRLERMEQGHDANSV